MNSSFFSKWKVVGVILVLLVAGGCIGLLLCGANMPLVYKADNETLQNRANDVVATSVTSQTETLFTYIDPILGTQTSTTSNMQVSNIEQYQKMPHQSLVDLVVKKCGAITLPKGSDFDVSFDETSELVSYSYLDHDTTYISFSVPYTSSEVVKACVHLGLTQELARHQRMMQAQRAGGL